MLVAARVAPTTTHIGLVPVATVHAHRAVPASSKAIATLDFVSHGGRLAAAGSAARRTRPRCSAGGRRLDLFAEAVDAVEVVRRLWDSWEDDAVIATSHRRYVDRDKLHYVDFVGRLLRQGPSITPRPPQGQPVVAALAHSRPDLRVRRPQRRSRLHHARRTTIDCATILDEVDRGRRRASAGLRRRLRRVRRRGRRPLRRRTYSTAAPTELVELLLRWQRLGRRRRAAAPRGQRDRPALHRRRGRARCCATAAGSEPGTPTGRPLRQRLGPAGRREPLRRRWCSRERAAVDPRPLADQRGQRRRDRAAQHRRPRPARRAVGLPPVLARRAPLRRRGQLVARGADRPARRRHRANPRRRGRRAARLHHGRRGRRELRHPRRAVSRPHRPRRRPVGSAAPRGQRASAAGPAEAAAADVARGRRRRRARAVRRQRADAQSAAAGAGCRCCSSPRPTRPTSTIRSPTSSRCSTAPSPSTGSRRTSCRASGAPLRPWVFGSSKGQSAQVAGGARTAVRRELPHHAGHGAGGGRGLPQRLRAVGGTARALRRGVGRRRGRRRHRHRRHLASSYGHWVYSIRAGDGAVPYPDPDASAAADARAGRAS